MLCGDLRAADRVGCTIINTMSALQLESGLVDPFLLTSYRFSTWDTDGWLMECWRILSKYKLELHSPSLWVPTTLCTNDKSFMQAIAEINKFENWQLCQINRCRMYLQIITISDLSTTWGTIVNGRGTLEHQYQTSFPPITGHLKYVQTP